MLLHTKQLAVKAITMDALKRWPKTELRAHLYVTHRRERSSKECSKNADLAAALAAAAPDFNECDRYQRIENGWRALAEMQDWLDGVRYP